MSRRRRRRASREEAWVTLAVGLVFVVVFLPAIRVPALIVLIAGVLAFVLTRQRAASASSSSEPALLPPLPEASVRAHAQLAGPDFAAYRPRREFFWWSEAAFYRVLVEAVSGRFVVFPKVRLLDICDVPSRDYSAQNRIDKKHIDFLLCDRETFRPAMAIELDGSSHQRRDRADSDAFKDELFGMMGIPLLRFRAQHHDAVDVRQRIERAIGVAIRTATTN